MYVYMHLKTLEEESHMSSCVFCSKRSRIAYFDAICLNINLVLRENVSKLHVNRRFKFASSSDVTSKVVLSYYLALFIAVVMYAIALRAIIFSVSRSRVRCTECLL